MRFVIALLLLAQALPAQRGQSIDSPKPGRGATERPRQLEGVRIDQKLNSQVPLGATFRDEHGREVTLGRFFGRKPVLLSLVYYECPMLCTVTLNGLSRTLKALSFDIGKEFEVVTVSINPKETPELAAAKKASHIDNYRRPGAEAGWHFLTGPETSIRALADAVGFRYRYDPESGEYAHAAGIMVLTPAGRVARYYYGVEFPARDVKFGLMEAASSRIGTPVDQVLLYCFHYDATSGKYTPAVLTFIRVGGTAVVLAFIAFVIVSIRRERRGNARTGAGAEWRLAR